MPSRLGPENDTVRENPAVGDDAGQFGASGCCLPWFELPSEPDCCESDRLRWFINSLNESINSACKGEQSEMLLDGALSRMVIPAPWLKPTRLPLRDRSATNGGDGPSLAEK